jgi:hypothetical protein
LLAADSLPAMDVGTITDIVTRLGVTGCLLVGLFWLATGRVVPRDRIDQMQKQLDAKDAALERKDAALARKDEQIQALQSGLVDKAIPTITEAILTMRDLTPIVEKLAPLIQTEVSIRDPRRPR